MIIMHRLPYIALVSFALLLSSCGSSGSSTDDDPTSPSTAARKVEFEGDRHGCRYGGVLVQTGIDENRNGTLDDDEVDASEAVCNGAPGADGATGDDGLTSLIKRTVLLPEDANCPAGGEFVETGIDDDRNGTLEPEEVDASAYLCNNPALLYAESEQPLALRSRACPLGGLEGHYGVDANGNSTLDAAEIDISLPIDCNTEVGLVLANEAASDRWSARQGHSSVVFDGKLWVLGGTAGGDYFDDVWSSTDGITWKEETASAGWAARSGHSSVVFDGKLWVLGGYDGTNRLNDVWSSEDGVTWEEETAAAGWSARSSHSSVVFDGKLWVLGGTAGGDEVWSSADGASWTQVTISGTSWSARYNHSSVVHAGKLWVLGGEDSTHLDDVWSSTDGASWTAVTAAAAWSARSLHSGVVYDGKLWVIGGFRYDSGSIFLDDVWSSTDGASWTEETPSATNWSGRFAHSSAVFDGYLWVLGGNDGGGPRNDVWVFAP